MSRRQTWHERAQQEASRRRKKPRPEPVPNLTLTHDYVEHITFEQLDELLAFIRVRNGGTKWRIATR